MNFFDKMYVGFQRKRYDKDENPRLLGFAVPYNDTQASKKRQDTVNGWRQKDIEPRIIDNLPSRGFKLLEVVSRYSTSNKLFRILDPRGFELEISADNLLDLAISSTIVKGEIIDECLWTSTGLIVSSNEHYVQYKKQKKEGNTKITPGSYYVSPGNIVSVFRYEGIYHHTFLNVSHKATKGFSEYTTDNYYRYNRKDIIVSEYDTNVTIGLNSGEKPVYIYTEFILDNDCDVKTIHVHARKSHFKNLIEHNDVITSMKEFKFDPKEYVNDNKTYATSSLITNLSGTNPCFFKTKEEAKSYDYNEFIKNKKYIAGYYYSIDVSEIENKSRSSYYNVRLHDNVKQNIKITDKR